MQDVNSSLSCHIRSLHLCQVPSAFFSMQSLSPLIPLPPHNSVPPPWSLLFLFLSSLAVAVGRSWQPGLLNSASSSFFLSSDPTVRGLPARSYCTPFVFMFGQFVNTHWTSHHVQQTHTPDSACVDTYSRRIPTSVQFRALAIQVYHNDG